MKKTGIKKIILTSVWVFVLLVVVLGIHIFMVTRPKAPSDNTIVMARVDLKQPVTTTESAAITEWLYNQPGVSHVLCNSESKIVVFTFYPVKARANEIVANLKTRFHLNNAIRYLPSDAELKSGCPVATTSVSYRAYQFITHIF